MFGIKSPFLCHFPRGQMGEQTFFTFQNYHGVMMPRFVREYTKQKGFTQTQGKLLQAAFSFSI